MAFKFHLKREDPKTRARRGEFHTAHGVVQTPVFMPVGTFASVKTLDLKDLGEVNAEIILGNTYHLMLRPGQAVFEHFRGLHTFMNWNKPILTDSGGFQIFCLESHRDIREEGASFRSYVNGDMFMLSPEKSIEMQTALGSDIMMVLDWCINSTSDHAATKHAMDTTHRWAKRSLDAKRALEHKAWHPQALFAIVQGGTFEDLRRESAANLTQHDFDGFAIGGLAVGETRSEREDFTELAAGLLPKEKPRYLMGVGTPIDLLEAIYRGVDMFDCVIPTMYAQRGAALTSTGRINITHGPYRYSDAPLDAACSCMTCTNYSRGYLHHLAKCKEPTGWRLLSLHNQIFYRDLMSQARQAIEEGRYLEFYRQKKAEQEPHRLTPDDLPTTSSATSAYSLSETTPAL